MRKPELAAAQQLYHHVFLCCHLFPATVWTRVDQQHQQHIPLAIQQAVRTGSQHGTCAAARGLLPRVLGLLSFDDGGGVVSRALAAASDMPLGVWLPHAPSLLSSLQRPEQRIAKALLIQLGVNFPQVM